MALGVDGIRVGCWTDASGASGTTVILPPAGTLGAAAVRGGAPGTREIAALSSIGSGTECHGVVLSGGSAFGLATADGVMAWCEAAGIGVDMGVVRVPVVGAAIVFDVRSPDVARPGREAGHAACEVATTDDPPEGLVGVGAGCTFGKTAGLAWAAPGGQGWAVRRGGGVTVGALLAVNPFGEVIGADGQALVAGRPPDDAERYPMAMPASRVGPSEHTVIGCLVTDAVLDKPAAARAADLAHSGIARAVVPAHTDFDGDALFLLATGRVEASVDLVAHLGALAVADAIRSAVQAANA